MARYDNNTAYDMHTYAMPEQTAPQHERVRRDWNVVEGGNSPHATTPLSPVVITVAKCVGALLATVLLTGLVKVFLVAATFGYLSQNTDLDTQLEAARYSASELEVQNSIYSDKDRVWSIATQVYGMTYPEQSAEVDLSGVPADMAAETE